MSTCDFCRKDGELVTLELTNWLKPKVHQECINGAKRLGALEWLDQESDPDKIMGDYLYCEKCGRKCETLWFINGMYCGAECRKKN